jgi:hypothetical protein
VIRSVPRLTSGALNSLPDSAKSTATLFRTVVATEVVKREAGFELARVGVGNAIPYQGREVIVSPVGPKYALNSLSTIESMVLSEVQAETDRGRLVANTPTFAVLRTPATVLIEGRHQAVDLHYAFCVNSQSGAQKTLCWAVRAGSQAAPKEIIMIPPKADFDCKLDVAVTRRVGPVPLSWSFAMTTLPPGQATPLSEPLGRLIASVAAGKSPAAELERAFAALPVKLTRR